MHTTNKYGIFMRESKQGGKLYIAKRISSPRMTREREQEYKNKEEGRR